MDRATIDGVTLEYQSSGSGEPVVFIHGALIADAFEPLRSQPRLADRYRLITYRRCGYLGSTRTPGPTAISQQAADCRSLLRFLGVDRAHVVGHSYGGSVALQLALDFPVVVQSLALLEPAIFTGATAQGYRDALAQGTRSFREQGAAPVVDAFLAARFGPGYRAVLDRAAPAAFDQALADAATFFEQEVPGLQQWESDEADLERISQPVLTMLGAESDALWPRFGETHRLLLSRLPHAEGAVLPGAAHGLQLWNPAGAAAALASFFEQNPMPKA